MVWKNPLEPLRGKSWRFLGNYRVVAAALLLTMVGLFWGFAGSEDYYPVHVRVTLADGTPVVGTQVSFESDPPGFAFAQVTDGNGEFAYGSKAMAGGAPLGTYRIQLGPSSKAILEPGEQGSRPTVVCHPVSCSLQQL